MTDEKKKETEEQNSRPIFLKNISGKNQWRFSNRFLFVSQQVIDSNDRRVPGSQGPTPKRIKGSAEVQGSLFFPHTHAGRLASLTAQKVSLVNSTSLLDSCSEIPSAIHLFLVAYCF